METCILPLLLPIKLLWPPSSSPPPHTVIKPLHGSWRPCSLQIKTRIILLPLIWLLSCFICQQFALDPFSPVTVALYPSRVPSHLRSSNMTLTQPEITFISFWGGTYSTFTFSFYRLFKKILLEPMD